MGAFSPASARVINPVLTRVAQGYKNASMVGMALFPRVPVGQRAGNILTFGRESFMLYNSQRAPGENTKRVQFGYSGSAYALLDYSLEGQLPIETQEEAEAVDNGFTVDMAKTTIDGTQDIMALRLEYAQAQLARTLANYASSNRVTKTGTAQWSDYSGTSNPIADAETAKEAIRAATGKRPNVCLMGAAVFAKAKQHPSVRDYIKYTGREVATPQLLADFFGVDEVLVGDSIYSNDAGTAFVDVWGKDVVFAYTVQESVANRGTPTYGYTYNLNGYPRVEQPYFERNPKSWMFPVTRAEAPVIAGAGAGYLIQNAVA